MKIIHFILMAMIVFFSCERTGKSLSFAGKEYWSAHHAGNDTTLHQEYKVYVQGLDTIIDYTNYYQNGALKSKVTMKNDLLEEITFVKDTVGKDLSFGELKGGNGYVIQFDSEDGSPEEEGLYVNGNREGWWKYYHYTGSIMDSMLYKNGYPQYPRTENTLDSLLRLFEQTKHNLYE